MGTTSVPDRTNLVRVGPTGRNQPDCSGSFEVWEIGV